MMLGAEGAIVGFGERAGLEAFMNNLNLCKINGHFKIYKVRYPYEANIKVIMEQEKL